MALTLAQAKQRIDRMLHIYGASGRHSHLPAKLTAGKVYEAWVLCEVLERFRTVEQYSVSLVGGSKAVLKSSGGAINPRYTHFILTKSGSPTLEVWTDVEFLTLSHSLRGKPRPPRDGDYHEMDIMVVPLGTRGRPSYEEVILAVECKHTPFRKDMLRAALGVRRELSLLNRFGAGTGFNKWPAAWVPARPPSCIKVYSTSPRVSRYAVTGAPFGVDFEYLPI